MGRYKCSYKALGLFPLRLGLRVVLSRVISPRIWVITRVTSLITPLITTPEPPSKLALVGFAGFSAVWSSAVLSGFGVVAYAPRHRVPLWENQILIELLRGSANLGSIG